MNHNEPTKKESKMIQDIQDEDADSFLRHWSERVWDRLQLAHIAEIERQLVDYAMKGWRPMNIAPPTDTQLLTSCADGIVVMTQNQFGEWRTRDGLPHKPPHAWMPCPLPSS